MPVQENRMENRNVATPVQESRTGNGNRMMPVQERTAGDENGTVPVQQNTVEDRSTGMAVQDDARDRMTARYEKRMDESMMMTRERGTDFMRGPGCGPSHGTNPCRRRMSCTDRKFCGKESFAGGEKPPVMGFCANKSCEKTAETMPWENETISENMMENYMAADRQ